VITRILTKGGYRVLTAADASEALDLYEQHGCGALLTDVILPGISGRRLAGLLHERQPDLPVLDMSGYSNGMQVGSGHTSKIFLAAARDVATIGADGRVAGDPEPPFHVTSSGYAHTRTSFDALARGRLGRGMQGQRASAINHR
jgi:CheY-like chemotaxis protein